MFNSQCIDVLFICNEWGSSKGGLSTFNREFAVNLAKASSDQIGVYCYVCNCSEEDRQDASKQGVNLLTARRVPGSDDPMEWLKRPPPELQNPDIVVGHGRKFGGAAYFISDRTKCKWIHFVHVFCEDLGKHKLEGGATADAIAENEEKNKREIELCEAADLVVAVGSQLQRKYSRLLPDIRVEVITPGMFEKFAIQANQSVRFLPAEEFSVFMFGRGSFEDFALKGYDIVGRAVASLGRSFELTFVGSPKYEQRRIEKWFLEETKLARNQLTIRGYCDYEEIKKMFRQADVIVMPSRTEGFGLVALEAISAGVPVLVSSECGIAKALKEVKGGMSVVVNSDMPEDWARRIRALSELKPKERHARAMHLREQYGKTYSWKKECARFEQMIHELVQRSRSAGLAAQDGNTMSPSSLADTEVKRKEQGTSTIPDRHSKTKQREWKKEGSSTTDIDPDKISKTTEWNKEGSSTRDTDQAPPTSLDNKEAASNKGGVLPTDSNKNTASRTFTKPFRIFSNLFSTKANRNKSIESATDTDQASPISLVNKEATSNKGGELPTGIDFVDKDKNEWNSLHDAAEDGDVTKIESLLSRGFPIDSRDDDGITPLMVAAYSDKLQAVEYLLAKGANPSLENNDGWNLLHSASQGGNPVIIELMLSHVPSIDSINNEGSTALMLAARHDKLQAVEYLLKKGANPSLKDNNGWNLLHWASQGGNPVIIELMLSHVPSIDSINNKGVTPLMLAANNDKLQAVEYLLKKGANPSLKDNNGWNLLHSASQGGNPVIIELMLGHVPSIDSINNKGVTALMNVAGHGKLQAVEYLLAKGADASLEDNDGWNLLHFASLGGNTAVIEKILSYGVDIESRAKDGSTPLMIAQRHGKSEAVTYLLSKGAKPF
ncbi:uncharacterized protein LOC144665210 [Oculina patagonica]